MFNFENKIIVITGAAQGNGKAIAQKFALFGAHVIITDINYQSLLQVHNEIAEKGLKVSSFKLDVSNLEECKDFSNKVSNEFDHIDVLINNAGVLRRGNFESVNVMNDLDDMIDVNVKGTFYLSHVFLELLKKSKGNIVNIASIQSFVASPTSTAYSVTKGGIAQLTKTLAVELAKYGIRVNAIAPGIIKTPMSQVTRDNQTSLDKFLAHVPLSRPGEPEEVVGPIAFLASEEASYVTGCILPVDGGYLTV